MIFCLHGFLVASFFFFTPFQSAVFASDPQTFVENKLKEIDFSQLQTIDEPTPYDVLAGLYEDAVVPKNSDVFGVQVGRCFDIASPLVPRASMVVGIERIEDHLKGPLFPKKSISKVFGFRSNLAAEFDDVKQAEVMIKDHLESLWATYLPVTPSKGELISMELRDSVLKNQSQYRYRMSKDYLVRSFGLRKIDEHGVETYQAQQYCYYFIRHEIDLK